MPVGRPSDRIRVLYVASDDDVASSVAARVERAAERLTVTTATSAESGLAHLSDEHVDCVLADAEMPGTDGIEFLEVVRERFGDVPFVLFADDDLVADALDAGVTDCLDRDTRDDLLANRLVTYGEKRRAEIDRHRQRALLETTQDGIALVDEDGTFGYVNGSYAALYGYDPAEMIGESWAMLYPEEEAAFVREEAVPAARSEGYWRGETTGLRADGTTFVEDHVLSAMASGALVCTVRDVTAKKERERELREEREFVAQALDTLSDAFYVVGTDGTVQRWNDTIEAVTGYDASEIEGRPAADFFAPEHRERIAEAVTEAIETGSARVEADFLTGDGERVPYEFTGTRLLDVDGDLRGLVGVGRDVSDRKAREREREATIAFLEQLNELTTDAGRSLDEKITDLLAFGSDHLGLQYGALTRIETDGADATEGTLTVVESHTPDGAMQSGDVCDLVETYCKAVVETDDLVTVADATETSWVDDPAHTESGLSSYIGGKVIVDGDLYGTVCFTAQEPREAAFTETERTLVRIVCRWVGYELERERARAAIEEKNDRLEEFASVVSHDLRNPLNVVLGAVETMERTGEMDQLDSARRAGERMEALIEDLLALAREERALEDRSPVALSDVATAAWGTVETSGATLSVDTDHTVSADEARLRQLFENLFRNAVEHGSTSPDSGTRQDAVEHGGDDGVTVTVGDTDDGFYVTDDGPGIPEDERERVFETGFSTSQTGSGLGLDIVARIADVHGWRVSVVDSDEGGTRFEFSGVDSVRERR